MNLPALATAEGLEARGADVSNVARVQAAIDDVSALIHSETGNRWVGSDGKVDPATPPVVFTVAYRVAGRMLTDNDVTSETVGPFQVTRASRDAFLNGQDKADLAGAVGSSVGLSVIRTSAPWPVRSRWSTGDDCA